MDMNIKSIVLAVIVLLSSTSINAALVERLGGLAYYDTDADLTWLADANAAGTGMSWEDSNSWAASLNVAGVTGWRLPDSLQPDASCSGQVSAFNESFGYNCTGSELGNLFYNVLGGSAGTYITFANNSNYDLFSNIQEGGYWTATERASSNGLHAWGMDMTGYQASIGKDVTNFYAWGVRSGDVSAVPVPAAAWLFCSGLLGLVGFTRRKKI